MNSAKAVSSILRGASMPELMEKALAIAMFAMCVGQSTNLRLKEVRE